MCENSKNKIVDLSYYVNHRDIDNFYTTKKIVEEALKKNFVDYEYKAKIVKVDKNTLDLVKQKALEIGIIDYISIQDLELCSIALQLGNSIVYTNDKYLQNLCYFFNIEFCGDVVIKWAKIFRYKCGKCESVGNTVICENCGDIRKRMVIKTFKVVKNNNNS